MAGDITARRDWSVMVNYDAEYFGAAAWYEEQRGGSTIPRFLVFPQYSLTYRLTVAL